MPFASFEVVVLFGMATMWVGMKEDFKVWSLKNDSVFIDTPMPYSNAYVWMGLQSERQQLSWCDHSFEKVENQ